MAQEIKMSAAGLKAMQEELEYLKTVRRKELAEEIKEARSHGDLSENSEYDEAKTEQGKLYSRIAELKSLVENAEIVEKVDTGMRKGAVTLGSRVKVRDIDEGYEEEYTVVGSQEANPMEGRVSDDSPFGRGLYGHVAGEKITVDAPAGELHFEMLSVEND